MSFVSQDSSQASTCLSESVQIDTSDTEDQKYLKKLAQILHRKTQEKYCNDAPNTSKTGRVKSVDHCFEETYIAAAIETLLVPNEHKENFECVAFFVYLFKQWCHLCHSYISSRTLFIDRQSAQIALNAGIDFLRQRLTVLAPSQQQNYNWQRAGSLTLAEYKDGDGRIGGVCLNLRTLQKCF